MLWRIDEKNKSSMITTLLRLRVRRHIEFCAKCFHHEGVILINHFWLEMTKVKRWLGLWHRTTRYTVVFCRQLHHEGDGGRLLRLFWWARLDWESTCLLWWPGMQCSCPSRFALFIFNILWRVCIMHCNSHVICPCFWIYKTRYVIGLPASGTDSIAVGKHLESDEFELFSLCHILYHSKKLCTHISRLFTVRK